MTENSDIAGEVVTKNPIYVSVKTGESCTREESMVDVVVALERIKRIHEMVTKDTRRYVVHWRTTINSQQKNVGDGEKYTEGCGEPSSLAMIQADMGKHITPDFIWEVGETIYWIVEAPPYSNHK